MLEPPDIPCAAILAALRAHYAIPASGLTFLPLGQDAAAWSYRVEAEDGASYFLKLRRGMSTGEALNEPGLLLPRFLADRGLAHVVAPLRGADAALGATLDDYALILYPFLEARQAAEAGMGREQWRAFGAFLRQAHDLDLPAELEEGLRRETFLPDWAAVVRELDEHIGSRGFDDPARQELAAFWQARRAEIRDLAECAEELGRRLRAGAPPLVLCHADIHTWNVLLDAHGGLWVVDWDEALLAPRERDLMFVVGGIGAGLVRPHEQAWFFEGYGEVALDALGLAYYRHAWAVGDIGAYGRQVFLQQGVGEESRRAAVRGFLTQFAPGNIVEIARLSEV